VDPLLSVQDLVIEFATPDGVVQAVNGVSYDLWPGETLAIVGESGSGKTVSAMSILGLVPQPPGRIVAGNILFEGRDLLAMRGRELRAVRGRAIAMIFQDPMTSLNPLLTVGRQIEEAITAHDRVDPREARRRAVALLTSVGVPNAMERIRHYPHQYSGGMRQRVLIAMAIANRPRVLIADEPTTALDVTIQAQIFDVLMAARRHTDASMILITHNFGLVAELADRVAVMYGGRVVETAEVRTLFHAPRHPYTSGLLRSMPRLHSRPHRLHPIDGAPPSLMALPAGCPFHPRCDRSRGRAVCREVRPPLTAIDNSHSSACHFADEAAVGNA
jgi:oligopeptide/dipeptide ABC transporter ATP-binding protein